MELGVVRIVFLGAKKAHKHKESPWKPPQLGFHPKNSLCGVGVENKGAETSPT